MKTSFVRERVTLLLPRPLAELLRVLEKSLGVPFYIVVSASLYALWVEPGAREAWRGRVFDAVLKLSEENA